MSRWTLSSAQFAALWARTGQDRAPFPFDLSSDLAVAEDHAEQQRRVRQTFDGPEHDVLAAAFLLLAEPDIRIELTGSADEIPLRIIGAMTRHHGLVALQHPRSAQREGGHVVMLGCEPYDVARQVLAQIPPTEPGRYRGVQFSRGSQARPGTRVLRRPEETSTLRPVADLLDRPTVGEGVVKVVRGPRHAGRFGGGAAWRDIRGDGRYIVFGGETVTVQPGSSWDLLGVLGSTTGVLPAGQAR
ncbi:ESX secretion-associated protein EspG [Rhodococcus sp. NPDC058521]|uniref:ESX secretion-associated protein EspG n=1 Tax=Rhodococcus sp. NPDC058521 TaxID=3346536 RepID=UPI003663AC6D